jgi:hypothetical protein
MVNTFKCFRLGFHSSVETRGRHRIGFIILWPFYVYVLGTWFIGYICVQTITYNYITVPFCVCFATVFTEYFPAISLGLSLVSGVYTIVVM